jgi:hypothetical protein
MAILNSSKRERDSWREVAAEYAEHFGWKIVPLHPRPDVAEEDKDDPVIRLLGRSPFVEIPEGATSRPDEIREWTGYPSAALAVLTGTGSNLVAIEIGPAAKRGLDEGQIKRLRASLPETRCVEGPDRDYYLFSLDAQPEDDLGLPRLARSDGVIFHGQGSIIRVPDPRSKSPVSAFQWSLGAVDEIAPLPTECLSFFGVKTGVESMISWSEQPSPTEKNPDAKKGRYGKRPGGDGPRRPECGTSPESVGGTGDSQTACGLSFRSGDQLTTDGDADGAGIGLRWLSPGALSVLCGQTKTSGKSTLAVNVATHLAAGRRFLGRDSKPMPVVMLSDLPVRRFRSLLSRIGVDREARERLHVLHANDAMRESWASLLTRTCRFAERKQAGLIVFDSLDQFVEAKGGVDATTNEEVAHILTSEMPADCAVLAVKALSGPSSVGVEDALERMGLLGRVADVVAMMDTGVTDACPSLRRLQFASRLEAAPTHLLCEMVHGRYQKVRRKSRDAPVYGDGEPSEDFGQGDGALPELLQAGATGDGEEGDGKAGPEAPESEGPRPSIVHQELSDASSDE